MNQIFEIKVKKNKQLFIQDCYKTLEEAFSDFISLIKYYRISKDPHTISQPSLSELPLKLVNCDLKITLKLINKK